MVPSADTSKTIDFLVGERGVSVAPLFLFGHDCPMKRIMIIGASGAGKSTLARWLGESLNLPVVHIDPMYFSEGWVQRQRAETEALIHQAIQADEWVFEGNFSSTFDERAELADLIVVLELGKVRRLLRTVWRTLRYYGRTRPEMTAGCPERFDAEFINWVWEYDSHSRPKMEAFVARWQGRRPIVRISSARQARRFGRDPHTFLSKAKAG